MASYPTKLKDFQASSVEASMGKGEHDSCSNCGYSSLRCTCNTEWKVSPVTCLECKHAVNKCKCCPSCRKYVCKCAMNRAICNECKYPKQKCECCQRCHKYRCVCDNCTECKKKRKDCMCCEKCHKYRCICNICTECRKTKENCRCCPSC